MKNDVRFQQSKVGDFYEIFDWVEKETVFVTEEQNEADTVLRRLRSGLPLDEAAIVETPFYRLEDYL